MRLDKKISIVTGGAGGIGKAIALNFAKEGSTVVIADSDQSKGQKVVSSILKKYSLPATFIKMDIINSEEVDDMARQVFDYYKHIDILVNCAGIYEDKLMLEMSNEEWDRTLKVNLYGCFFCTRSVSTYMKMNRKGSIINIASIGGQKAPSIGHSHYAASKAGMIGFTRAIAIELAEFGIRVNNICPGVTQDTPMGDKAIINVSKEKSYNIPIDRYATPLDISYGAVYLASDESSYITGSTLSINGGLYME